MSLWFRFYTEALDDPKVQSLPPELFRAWVNCLCVAAKNDGYLPDATALAFHLRCSCSEVFELEKALHERGLLDKGKSGWKMHSWDKRQFKSDVSTDRVKRFRKRTETVSGNAPDTETDTEPPKAPQGGRRGRMSTSKVLMGLSDKLKETAK